MENEWIVLLRKVSEKEIDAASWKSDKASLIGIIEWARDNGISSEKVSEIQNTKLRTIIKEAKKAKLQNDISRMSELFEWAKTMTIIDLRHMVNITKQEDLMVFNTIEKGKHFYSLRLTKIQFERIKKSTRAHFRYTVLPVSKDLY